MSESGFLLTNSDYQAFIFVWQEVVDSKTTSPNSLDNQLMSFSSNQRTIEETHSQISTLGMVRQQLASTKQITLYSSSAGVEINFLIVASEKSMLNVYQTNILHEIANSWNPDSKHISINNHVCTPKACSIKY